MKRGKLAVQCGALVLAYGLACSDLREFLVHPAQSPARTVRARLALARPLADSRVSVEQVATVLRAVAPSLQASCGAALSPSTSQASKVVLQLGIEASGYLNRLVLDATQARPDLASCVARGIEPLHFADGTVPAHVTVSFAFGPGLRVPKLELWTTPLPP